MKTFLFITLCSFTLIELVSSLNSVLLKDCEPGKFFWGDEDPTVFFACLQKRHHAVKMRCRSGTKMCLLPKGQKKTFGPCQCSVSGSISKPLSFVSKSSKPAPKSGILLNSAVVGQVVTSSPVSSEVKGECKTPNDAMASCGCPDQYKLYPSTHMYGGEGQAEVTSVKQCQQDCISMKLCIGIDWITNVTDVKDDRCYFIYPASTQMGLAPFPMENSDHYRRTFCKDNQTESTLDNGKESNVPVEKIKIPDSGCPFSFERIDGKSHPFGRNITLVDNSPEACKLWCLTRSFCAAVDFDHNKQTCFYMREAVKGLLSPAALVTHFRKTTCAPPLSCWLTPRVVVTTREQLSVTDSRHQQKSCKGICFTSLTLTNNGLVQERGCQEVTGDAEMDKFPVGCSVENGDLPIATVCYCDTPRCNGISIQALTSQILYLPLDGDLDDHSGSGHHATTVSKQTRPRFTCLDKAVNCSKIFNGGSRRSCIRVDSMLQTTWGRYPSNQSSLPEATFVVWFKRRAVQRTKRQGIFGSEDSNGRSPWSIYAMDMPHFISAGVSVKPTKSTSATDYRYVIARADQWHLAALSYEGGSLLNGGVGGASRRGQQGVGRGGGRGFPLLRFYADGRLQVGNARSDQGELPVRDSPVTIGCIGDDHFTGFIDEARIFSTALSIYDINALKVIREGQVW